MIALLMVLPWIASLLDPGYAHAGNFAIGLMLTAFVSGALLLSGYTSRRHRANGIELLLIMVLFWSFLPAIAAIPFIGASQIDGLLAAYFEAVSALTTSGGSMLSVPQAEATPILLWRAVLSWLGGLWTLVFAVAVLAPFGIGGITLIGSPLLQHEENAPLFAPYSASLSAVPTLALSLCWLCSTFGGLASAISTSGMSIDEQPSHLLSGGGQGVCPYALLAPSCSVDGVTLGRRRAVFKSRKCACLLLWCWRMAE